MSAAARAQRQPRPVPARAVAGNHIAAIHALKAKCGLSDDDYRALLHSLTGQRSSKDLGAGQQLQVRQRLQKMAERSNPAASARRAWLPQAEFDAQRKAASPQERKLWALWGALGRAGKLEQPTPAGLQVWVQRQTGVSALRFCNAAQIEALIESAKLWLGR